MGRYFRNVTVLWPLDPFLFITPNQDDHKIQFQLPQLLRTSTASKLYSFALGFRDMAAFIIPAGLSAGIKI